MSEDPQTQRAEQLIGRVLSDRYRVDELIAAGSMAAVYLGLHLNMRKQVAIKILHPQTENFPDLVTRFEREAVAGAHISHPNVAAASDMGTFDDGSYFLVLEYVRGRTLREVIASSGAMPAARAIHIGRQLASALSAIHAKGIIHRDLKPRNVMVTDGPQEVVKLIDFGLARVEVQNLAPLSDDTEGGKKALSAAGVVFGTVGYMPPETALGMGAVDERSDLYSFGVILYEMLTGQPPFTEIDPKALFAQHRYEKPVAPSKRSPPIVMPSSLETLVMSLLEKDPAARPPNVDSVIADLDEVPLGPEESSEHIFTAPPHRLSAARNLALGGVIVALLAVGMYWLAWGRSPKSIVSKTAAGSATAQTAAPPPSASASPVDPASFGAKSTDDAALAVKLRGELLASKDDADAIAILVELADVAPGALRDPETRTAAKRVAEQAGEKTGPETDRVYYVLSYKFGTEGLDVLYEVRMSATSPKSALRAAAILDHGGTSDRASPALRTTLTIMKSACRNKQFLFAKAGADGDARTLAMLETLQPPGCDAKSSPCCYRRNLDLERSIATLKDRATQPR